MNPPQLCPICKTDPCQDYNFCCNACKPISRICCTSAEEGIKYGIPIKLHDWVVVRPSDTWSLDINGNPDVLSREDFVTCRMVYPHHIRARISNPALVW